MEDPISPPDRQALHHLALCPSTPPTPTWPLTLVQPTCRVGWATRLHPIATVAGLGLGSWEFFPLHGGLRKPRIHKN